MKKPLEVQKTPEDGVEGAKMEGTLTTAQAMEMASTEAKVAFAEFDTLSTTDADAMKFEMTETTALQSLAQESKTSVDDAMKSFEADLKRSMGADNVPSAAEKPEVKPIELTELPSAGEEMVIERTAVVTPETRPAPVVETVTAPTVTPEAKAAQAVEVPAGRKGREDLEMTEAGKTEDILGLDWESMIAEEGEKFNQAKGEYEKTSRHLMEEQQKYPKPWAPIQQKYFEALVSDVAVSELSLKHAQNQVELYSINRDIEHLGADAAMQKQIDALIASRDAKDALSRTLAEGVTAEQQKRDQLVEAYTKALTHVTPEAAPAEGEGLTSEDLDMSYTTGLTSSSMPYAREAASDRTRATGSPLGGLPSAPAAPKKPGIFGRIAGFFRKKIEDDVKAVTFQK